MPLTPCHTADVTPPHDIPVLRSADMFGGLRPRIDTVLSCPTLYRLSGALNRALPTLLLAPLVVACGPESALTTDATTSASSSAATTGAEASTEPATDPTPTTSFATTTAVDSTTTTTTDSADAPSESGLLFLDTCPEDPFARCSPPLNECNPFTQDCKRGEKCAPYADDGGGSWNNDKCVPVDPDPDQPGESCIVHEPNNSGLDSCDVGAVCWHVDTRTLTGTCTPLCTGNADMGICPDDLLCAVYNEGTLPLCLPACDPLQQDCPAGDLCIGHPNGEAFLCVLDASGDEGQVFDPCDYLNSCDPGLLCNDATAASECDPGEQGCCLPFCDLTLPLDCPGAMQTCQPYFEMGTAPDGYENVGYCALPDP